MNVWKNPINSRQFIALLPIRLAQKSSLLIFPFYVDEPAIKQKETQEQP